MGRCSKCPPQHFYSPPRAIMMQFLKTPCKNVLLPQGQQLAERDRLCSTGDEPSWLRGAKSHLGQGTVSPFFPSCTHCQCKLWLACLLTTDPEHTCRNMAKIMLMARFQLMGPSLEQPPDSQLPPHSQPGTPSRALGSRTLGQDPFHQV